MNMDLYLHMYMFILKTEHYTLHTTCLYCLLHIYPFTLQTSKICLSGTKDLHGKINLNLWKHKAVDFQWVDFA